MALVTPTFLKRRPFGKHWIVSGTIGTVTNGAADFFDTGLSDVRSVSVSTTFSTTEVGYIPNSNDGTEGTAPGFITLEATTLPQPVHFNVIGERDF